ncbi:transposase [Elusimicrobiota bacterium]
MVRIARLVGEGLPHHVTQRGNNKQKIFFDDYDRQRYLSLVQEYSKKYDLTILSYCLMPNHVHFIIVPHQQEALAKFFASVHTRYSQYFNKKRTGSGHLFQGRFFSCILDHIHLLAAARYIERNPVRERLVEKPWDWEWSSARYHIGKGKPAVPLGDLFELIDMNRNNWKSFTDSFDDENVIDAIRNNTMNGRPLGVDAFLEKLENVFGVNLRNITKGRPFKE